MACQEEARRENPAGQLVEKVLRTFPPSWGKFLHLLHKFRNFVIPTRKKTLTVFFHTIFPSETSSQSGFSTVCGPQGKSCGLQLVEKVLGTFPPS